MYKKLVALGLSIALLCVGCGTVSDNTTKTEKNAQTENNTQTDDNAQTEKKEITEVTMTADQNYDDGTRAFEFLGLKEYKKIKGEKFTDTPAKGNIYLVLFLLVNIKSDGKEEKFYFNYNYLSAKVDGKEIVHKPIINDPCGYDTLLKNYTIGQDAGRLAYEVPPNWKKLEIVYSGLKDIAGNNLTMIFTPKDLKDPEEKYKVIPEQSKNDEDNSKENN